MDTVLADALARNDYLERHGGQVSDLDIDRRSAIIKRAPDRFSDSNANQKSNFCNIGLLYSTGHLAGMFCQ
jgi:hypothetical protein